MAMSWSLNDRPKAWKLSMLAASYVFYAAWDWKFLGLIMLSSVANALFAVSIHSASERARRPWLIAGVGFNLGLLGYFKYYSFFVSSLVALLNPFGLAPTGLMASIVLPIAISFFTFQGISYLVDVYRRETEPYALVEVALYLSFFPHLVAGPIVRAQDFIPQLRRRRNPDAVDVSRAVRLIGRGMFKKVVVASTLATFVDPVFAAPGKYHALAVVVGIWAYAIQLYADFSGYTDMAIGIALLLGFKFPQNFDRPYAALSIQQFWRRWHITLSDWLRDYVYIPLGGNKDGHTNRNLVMTMALGGLWHGASWSFVIWGLYHGFGLAAERTVTARRAAGLPVLSLATLAPVRARSAQRAAKAAGPGVEFEVHPGERDETVVIDVDAGMDVEVGAGRPGGRVAGPRGGSARGDSARGGSPRGDSPRAGGGRGDGRREGGPEGPIRRWVRRNTDEIEFDEEWNRLRAELESPDERRSWHPVLQWMFVFHFVCIGWVFFRSPTLSGGFSVLGRVATGWGAGEIAVPFVVLVLILGSLVAQWMPSVVGNVVEYRFSRMAPIVQAVLFGVFLSLVQVLGPQGVAPFIYFQF